MKLNTYSSPDENTRKIFKMLGGDDFDRMRSYLSDMKRAMNNQKAMLTHSHKEELILFPLATGLTNDVYKKHYENYDVHFLGILFNSTLVASHSLFEVIFLKVVYYVADKRGVIIPPKYFEGTRIAEKCKQYIEVEIGLDLSKIEKYWRRLLLSKALRNKIIHHNSLIPAGNKELRKFVRRNKYIKIDKPRSTKDFTFYIQDQLYIFDFLDISSSYLLWILMRV